MNITVWAPGSEVNFCRGQNGSRICGAAVEFVVMMWRAGAEIPRHDSIDERGESIMYNTLPMSDITII